MFTTLISAPELAARLNDATILIVDCRHDLMDLAAGRAAYDAGHLPGAVFADMETELAGPRRDAAGFFRGRHPLPSPEQFIALLRRWGVNDNTQVVAYDAHGGMYAARLWWMLRWVGHEAVAVLNGGLAAWAAAGQSLTTALPAARPAGNISLGTPLVSTVDAAGVLANIDRAVFTVVDARSPDRYRGENEVVDPVGGHIPGAKNRFFKDNLAADGRFKSPVELQADWAALGIDPARAVMQCGSGVTACHNLLALEVAGLKGAALYAGSWSEWSADPARPVA
ncbi:MAG: sulfurtransferase [Massilia sp.]